MSHLQSTVVPAHRRGIRGSGFPWAYLGSRNRVSNIGESILLKLVRDIPGLRILNLSTAENGKEGRRCPLALAGNNVAVHI